MWPVSRNPFATLFFEFMDRLYRAFPSKNQPTQQLSEFGTTAFLILVNVPIVPWGDSSCGSEDKTGIQSLFQMERH